MGKQKDGRMFTGIVTDIGEVITLEQRGDLRARIATGYDVDGIDIGASIGAGGTVNLGGMKLFVDARYTHGFNKLDNIPVIDLDFKNKNFALTTGFLIPLNKGYSSPRA